MNINDAMKSAVHGMPALATGGMPGYRAGDEKLAWSRPELSGPEMIRVQSAAFEEGMAMPMKYSADGEEMSPPVAWSNVPEEAKSMALVVEDPDAPTPEPFVHWLVFNLPPKSKSLVEGASGNGSGSGLEGKNSKLKSGWAGMAPPKGDMAHRYIFQVFALDQMLQLKEGAGRGALFDAMAGHVIALGKMVGTYQRPK